MIQKCDCLSCNSTPTRAKPAMPLGLGQRQKQLQALSGTSGLQSACMRTDAHQPAKVCRARGIESACTFSDMYR